MLRSTKKHTTTQAVSVRKAFPKQLPSTEATFQSKLDATNAKTIAQSPEEEFKSTPFISISTL